MRYVQLGRTGVRVSVIALGTDTFGVAPLEGDAERLVGRALDLGVNVIDMANSYGNQSRFDRPGVPPAAERASAEEIIGRAIQGKRSEVVLCSKVMEVVGSGVNDRGLSRRHIFDQVERSLARLGTDHLDLLQVHASPSRAQMEGDLFRIQAAAETAPFGAWPARDDNAGKARKQATQALQFLPKNDVPLTAHGVKQ